METLCTMGKKTTIINRVVAVLVALLVLMICYDLLVLKQYYFMVIEVMCFFIAADYLRRNLSAFITVTFRSTEMDLSRKEKKVIVSYDQIASLRETKNGFIVISVSPDKEYLVYGEPYGMMRLDDPERTINALHDEIKRRSGKDIEVTYKK